MIYSTALTLTVPHERIGAVWVSIWLEFCDATNLVRFSGNIGFMGFRACAPSTDLPGQYLANSDGR